MKRLRKSVLGDLLASSHYGDISESRLKDEERDDIEAKFAPVIGQVEGGLNMVRIFFCPFCHRFFKDESRVFRVLGGPEPIETHEVLLRKALEFLGLQEKTKDGLEVDFRVICGLCLSTDEGGASYGC